MAKSKYKEWITKEGLLKIEGWAKDGLTDEDIAYNMGIRRGTLYEWKKKYPDIDDTLKTGKEVVDRKVENALFKNAMGYEYTEVKEYIEQTDDGKKKKRIEKTTKHVPANTTAQIFWLKNRKPKQWRDKQDVEHSGGLNITVDWGEEDEG